MIFPVLSVRWEKYTEPFFSNFNIYLSTSLHPFHVGHKKEKEYFADNLRSFQPLIHPHELIDRRVSRHVRSFAESTEKEREIGTERKRKRREEKRERDNLATKGFTARNHHSVWKFEFYLVVGGALPARPTASNEITAPVI